MRSASEGVVSVSSGARFHATTHDNYLLLDARWDGIQRIHHIIAHLRIHNGKILVEVDNTDQEIIQQLLDAGIPKASIVLAFYSPQNAP